MHCARVDPARVEKFTSFVNSLGDANVLSGYTSLRVEDGIQLEKFGKHTELSKLKNELRTKSDLRDGEFGTELVDPFAEMPLPR
jgi:hypothetical protein